MTEQRHRRQIEAPVSQVYLAFANDTHLCEWLCSDAKLAAVEGGAALLINNDPVFSYAGTIDQLEPDASIGFDLRRLDGEGEARLLVTIAAEDGGSDLEITLSANPGDPLAELVEARLRRLVALLETGYDLRIAELPLIGVMPGPPLDAAALAQRGVNEPHGLTVVGTVPDLSAAKAGVRADDVLLEAAGTPLANWRDFRDVVTAHAVGDRLPIRYLRDGAIHEVELELLARPMPVLPTSAAEAAEAVRSIKRDLEREFEALFEGVTAAEAAHKPAADSWSADEVIAHLINTERDHQAFIASLLISDELEVFSSNHPSRVGATVARYGGNRALLAALKGSHAETVQMYASLSAEQLTRKGTLIRCLLTEEGNGFHSRHHQGQIRRALAAVRGAVPA